MNKSLNLLAVLALSSLMALTALADNDRRITVSGTGEVVLKSDAAVVRLAVVTRDVSAVKALRENAKVATNVFNELVKAGFDKESITTSNYNIYREENYNRKSLTGSEPQKFRVRNSMQIAIADVGRVGEAIDIAGTAGANEFSNVSFSVVDDKDAMNEARESAIRNARAIAERMAAAAGAKLGKIVSINENGVHNDFAPRPLMKAALMNDAAVETPISAGKQTVKAEVTCVYELE